MATDTPGDGIARERARATDGSAHEGESRRLSDLDAVLAARRQEDAATEEISGAAGSGGTERATEPGRTEEIGRTEDIGGTEETAGTERPAGSRAGEDTAGTTQGTAEVAETNRIAETGVTEDTARTEQLAAEPAGTGAPTTAAPAPTDADTWRSWRRVDDRARVPAGAPGSHPEQTQVLPAAAPPPASRGWGDAPETEEMNRSPLAGFPAEEPKRRSHRGLVLTLVILAVLVVGYGAAAWFLGDRTPNGTTVAGVGIGGLPRAEATERLETELGPLASEPIPVAVGERAATIDPATAGLGFDAAATVHDLTGFTLDPRVLWGRLTDLGDVEPVTTVDEAALEQAVAAAATELDVAPVEGFITFAGAAPEVTEPVPGSAVAVDDAATVVRREWLTAARPLQLPAEEVPPTIGPDAVQTALTTLAEPLVSGPVAVDVGGTLAELSPEQLAANAAFVPEGGALHLQLDGEGLAAAVSEGNPGIVVAGEDAKIVLQGGAPTIVPSTTGKGLAPDAVAEAVLKAGTSTDRTAEVPLVESEPDFTTAEAEALGVKEVIGEFSTPMPYDPVRTSNLKLGTQRVSNVLVLPGKEFSLLDAIAPITAANGYVSSGVVEEGFATTALGGGLSQLSTTLYNAAFFAGMDDVAHTPHSRWFSRYPQGREATVWEPAKDMVWRNNTDFGVLVEAWVSADQVHARLWGTDVWDVQTSTSDRYNIVPPKTVTNPSPECKPESAGEPGFTVTVTRQRSRDGVAVDPEKWTWTYSPWNKVVCQ
ncbi:VanW family protein [Georgenia sp. TF02-10]|uniref:VanW family protein n=1 Tax=Georgenia sp. TF02-10 TaxID=2917725 RepID=UPI001FA7D36D|nr:VanW family protein [Georgenia sp. TF02-10]UNX55672.1 VanW family protein [Georgenia sp. TF02-10]